MVENQDFVQVDYVMPSWDIPRSDSHASSQAEYWHRNDLIA